MQTFFALCKPSDQLIVMRLDVDRNVQSELAMLFKTQETEFRVNPNDEVGFNGDWKPDEDEVLYVSIPDQTDVLENAIKASPLSVQTLNVKKLAQQGLKAIFTGQTKDEKTVVLIQKFTSQQLLEHKLTLTLSNNVLNRLTEPTFTLDNKLVGIVEDGKLKFKSYFNIRTIFDLSNLYRSATDGDIDNFAGHKCLNVSNVNVLKEAADQTARKLIHAIQRDGILDEHTAIEIQKRAKTVGLSITINKGKIQVPTEKAEIKRFLRFLHDDIYEAPLSKTRYVTNSKKPE